MGAVVAKVAVEDIVLPTLSQIFGALDYLSSCVYLLFVIYSVFISLFFLNFFYFSISLVSHAKKCKIKDGLH